ncbi:hypothetical protein HJA84_24320 [Rhizobium bangladeshense]|nr:hypothetical protein [Rhizobium bangladeshense]
MQITRAELYQRVCDSPLSKIAPQFGISGTALAALCKAYEIPYPGSGHWTRKLLGLPSELPPLPEGDDQLITITPKTPRPREIKSPNSSRPRKAEAKIKEARTHCHPMLVGVEAGFRKTREAKDGEFLRPYKRILPDLISTESSLPRALSIANDLYTAFDKRGYRVLIAPADAKMQRVHVNEQEVDQKDRKYGRYHFGTIWAPDRPTIAYIGAVPIGLAVTEMTERVTMRYVNGDYHREDSKVVRSAKPWQLERSWTTEQDLPCGRFRVVAFSPKLGVNWHLSWQETVEQPIPGMIPKILENLEKSTDQIQTLMIAADEAAARQQREWEEQWERYNREEDKRRVAQALRDSQQQLTEIIDLWGKAMTIERFFIEAEKYLASAEGERQQHLKERLILARSMLGSLDPLNFFAEWLAPKERYQTKYI